MEAWPRPPRGARSPIAFLSALQRRPRYQEKRPSPSGNSGRRCSPNGPRISPSAFTARADYDRGREQDTTCSSYRNAICPANDSWTFQLLPVALLLPRGSIIINPRTNESTVSRTVCAPPLSNILALFTSIHGLCNPGRLIVRPSCNYS